MKEKFRMEGVASNASVGVNPTVGYDVATSYDRKNEELVAESIAVLGSSVITGHTDVADCHTENTPMPVAMFAGKNDEAFCLASEPKLWVYSSVAASDELFSEKCAVMDEGQWCLQEGWQSYNLPFNQTVPSTDPTRLNKFWWVDKLYVFRDFLPMNIIRLAKVGWWWVAVKPLATIQLSTKTGNPTIVLGCVR